MSQDYIEQVAWLVLKNLARRCKTFFSKKRKENKDDSTKQLLASGDNAVGENLEESVSNNSDKNSFSGKGDKNEESREELDEEHIGSSKKESLNTQEEGDTSEKSPDKLENNEELVESDQTLIKESLNKENTTEAKSEPPTEQGVSEDGLASNLSSTNNAIFFHSSMFFMWVIITVLNVPAVLTWAHNFKYSRHLVADESFLPGLILCLCALPLWQLNLPRTNRKYTSALHILTLCIMVISFLYATVSVYRLNYTLTILFALIVIQQCYAPKIESESEDGFDDSNDKKQENKYDEMKMKMD